MGYRYIDEDNQHLHTLDGKPLLGASTVVGVVDKSAPLMKWAVKCAVEYLESRGVETIVSPDVGKEYKGVIVSYEDLENAKTAYIKKRDKAADDGTNMHAELEQYVRECIAFGGVVLEPVASTFVAMFQEWAAENVERFVFSEGNCYSERLWTGGISDGGLILKNGKRAIIDFKSSREAYQSQFLQCALYDIMLKENGILDKDGNKLGEWEGADEYIVFPFRSSPFKPEFRHNVEKCRENAGYCVSLYKFNRKM